MKDEVKEKVRAAVRGRYGQIAQGKASGCCGAGSAGGCCAPASSASSKLGYAAADLAEIPEEADMGLGCGNPQAIAALRPGETVLDLGAGGGIDCFLAARQVGESGHVIGVDMTAEMVAKARANARSIGAHNVEFRLGEIEHLPVADGTVDVILSNCVINLSPDKAAVFREAFRVLRPGGRLAISDVVATAPLPEALAGDVEALTGCMAGAVSPDTLHGLLAAAGFVDIRIEIDEASRELIAGWLPGSGAEAYVASARITASRPKC